MSSRARPVGFCVVDHLLVDDIGQSSFQAAHGFHRGLAGGELAPVVATAFGVVAQLDDGHDVQDPVDAPVPGAGEPVTLLVAGGGVERCGAVPGGEVPAVWRSGRCHRCRRAAGRRRTGRSRELLQPAAGGVDESVSCRSASLILLVDDSEFGDQLGRPAGVGCARRCRAGGRWPAGRGPAGRTGTSCAPPGISSSSRCATRLIVSVRARPSSSRRSASSRNATVASSALTWRKPVVRNATTATECGVDRVGLAALAGGEHPHPRRQLRRHIHHRLAVGDQPLGDVPADAVAALDRPDPVPDRRPASASCR